jgi:hypothetical protein
MSGGCRSIKFDTNARTLTPECETVNSDKNVKIIFYEKKIHFEFHFIG